MRRRAAFCGLVLLLGCERFDPTPASLVPEVLIDSPIDADSVPFNRPFRLRGVARAPQGGTLLGAEVILSGAAFERRSIDVGGTEAEFDVELTVARDVLLGPDRLPLDVVVVLTASIDGRIVRSAPKGISLFVVDAEAPVIDVDLTPDGTPRPGFDATYPAGTVFTMTVRAADPIGGLEAIEIDAPAFLGGSRRRVLDGARTGTFAVTFAPPRHADFELVVRVRDVARTVNITTQTFRIQVGDGGTDTMGPVVTFDGLSSLECGATATIGVAAVDDIVGVDRLTVQLPGGDLVFYGTNVDDPRILAVTASITTPRIEGPIEIGAVARDFVGHTSSRAVIRPEVRDTQGPILERAAVVDPNIIPGAPLAVAIRGRDLCADIDVVGMRLTDDIGRVVNATTAIGAPSVDSTTLLPIPESLCVLAPIQAEIRLVDANGFASLPADVMLDGLDQQPPVARINTLVPGTGLAPGEQFVVRVQIDDPQSGVASATVTLTAQGLDLPAVLLTSSATYPTADCADTISRTLNVAYQIPNDVRFTAPMGAIVVRVDARDGAGLVTTQTAAAPVVCGAPTVSAVQPAVAPVSGGVLIRVVGTGLAAGADIALGPTVLTGVIVEGPTSATGWLAAGTYAPGAVDVVVTNRCGALRPSDRLVGGFRFVAPPVVTWVRPRLGATAEAGDVVWLTAAATADGVVLSSLSAGAPGALQTQPSNAVADVVDTTVFVPLTATTTVGVVTIVEDSLGQVTTSTRVLTIGPPVPLALELRPVRTVLGVGESIGVAVLAAMSDGRVHDVSDLANLTSRTATVATINGLAVRGVGVGRAVLDGSLGSVQASVVVDVVADGLAVLHPALYFSAGGAPAPPTIVEFVGGVPRDATTFITLSSGDPLVASIQAGAVRPLAVGRTVITAQHTAAATVTASFEVVVADRLDVSAGIQTSVPSAQRFTGGTIAGAAWMHRPLVAAGPWQVTVDAGGTLAILATGRLDGRGQPGDTIGHGGVAHSDAGGGGAGLGTGGRRGGFGEPTGASTADDLPTTLGGTGGGPSGGQGARLDAASAGAGGGSAGSGGDGGGVSLLAAGGVGAGALVARGGAGGGGGRAGGGGGGGGRVELILTGATLQLDGLIAVAGGAGAAHQTSTSGGGGGGGVLTIRAQSVVGAGRIDAGGGAGGALIRAGVRGSGGGGGGGLVDLSNILVPSLVLEIIADGGVAADARGVASAGRSGAPGLVLR